MSKILGAVQIKWLINEVVISSKKKSEKFKNEVVKKVIVLHIM